MTHHLSNLACLLGIPNQKFETQVGLDEWPPKWAARIRLM